MVLKPLSSSFYNFTKKTLSYLNHSYIMIVLFIFYYVDVAHNTLGENDYAFRKTVTCVY